MFKKLLVANRGEIARRVFRACRELGLRTAAVYSEADRDSAYVAQADEAHLLGPPPPRESYLRIDRVIEIAKSAHADAIHPGYGFLSENPDFSDACAKAGIKFVGPRGDSMRAVGNKIAARRVAEENGVPVIAGVSRAVDEAGALAFAKKNGFPVLLKAASGGGGRGQRVVRSEKEIGRALREAASEAASAFGDGTIFVERYVDRPRHVEIQLLADAHGHVVHLGERECSIQRRHQKLLEESPSPAVDDALRDRMGQAACRIAKAVGYESVGTCEFLVDAHGGFSFLEVNARLQVEHPVTEMLTGIDLVKQQIAVAAGAKLAIAQDDVHRRGHAIEVRVCAEDPYSGFAPSIGEVAAVRLPAGPFVRVDADLVAGTRVTPYYDSLLAKVIAWGADRAEAIERMARALRETVVVGVQTTIPFHLELLSHARFRAGDVHTSFVEREMQLRGGGERRKDAVLIAAALELARRGALVPAVSAPRPLSAWQTAFREEPP